MTIRKVLFVLILLATAQPGLADNIYTRIPDGDVDALRAAMRGAYSRPASNHVILLAGTFEFGPDDGLPEVRTQVTIYPDRKPAHFVGLDGGPAPLIHVAGGGSLELTNVELSGFYNQAGTGDRGVLVNDGKLILRKVQIRDNSNPTPCSAQQCAGIAPLVLNRSSGEFHASQVSVIDSGIRDAQTSVEAAGGVLKNLGNARLQNFQLYLTQPDYAPAFQNAGQMWVTNASLMTAKPGTRALREWIVSPGRLQVANTIVSGFASTWCRSVISAGFNLVDNPACAMSSREDIVGAATGLRWVQIDSDWLRREEELLTHVLAPIAASPAVDSANDAWCPRVSIETSQTGNSSRNRDGDDDGTVRCDRGAYEIPRKTLQAGGINGLYYNPQADGHYIYIADTRYNTMVMWTTFDASGKQAWIFGIAEKAVAGRSLIADAYINRDGRVSLTGDFDPATTEHWGHLEFELTGCYGGDFLFASDSPEFGSGQFQVERLAYVKRLGCSNSTVGE